MSRWLQGRRGGLRFRRLQLEFLEDRSLMAGELRFVTYNVHALGDSFGRGNGLPSSDVGPILQAIGNEVRNGLAKQVDLLALQEVRSSATTSADVVAQLNAIYGAGVYARGMLNGNPTSDTQGLVYNTLTLDLLDETAIGVASSTGQPRQTIRYRLRPDGGDSTSEFYVYNGHFKSGTDDANPPVPSDADRREIEALAIRADADALGSANIIYVGDFNLQNSSEDAYQVLLGAGHGQAFDPINRPGNWHTNNTFKDIVTQAPLVTALSGFTGGGLDDRFDFQLISGELTDGTGLEYLSGSYHTFGINGSLNVNSNVNDSGNTALPLSNFPNRITLLNQLAYASDHLPVVADYQFSTVNNAPTNIALSPTAVAENAGANATVGTFTTTDPDSLNTFTYALVSGTGDTDNSLFTTSGNTLRAVASLNHEAASTRSVRVRSTDQGGLFFEKQFTITVTNVNEAPTDISLSNSSINENLGGSTTVGTFSTSDVDAGSTFTYTLVSGSGSSGNGSFFIDASGNLKTAISLDYEEQNSYSIRVRSTDNGGLFFEKQFTVSVNDLNEAPTDLFLSISSIPENQASGTTVGSFSMLDPDVGDVFSYALVSGAGSADNSSFTIGSSSLQTAASFNYELQSSFFIRVRGTDQAGLFFERPFVITVSNVNEPPVIAPQSFSVPENSPNGTSVGTVIATDPDAGDTKTFAITSGNLSGAFAITGNTGIITVANSAALDFETTPIFSLTVVVIDAGGLSASNTVTVQLSDVAELFRVTSFTPTNTGFVTTFSQPFVAADLNLWGNAALGPADVTLIGATSGAIRGSLILNATHNELRFVRTQAGATAASATGILPNDTYTVTFRSAANGFHTASGALLDGDGNGTEGDHFTTSFLHSVPVGAVSLSIPDFARGHGQAVHVPNNGTGGLPLYLGTGQNVSSLQMTVNYDPALLTITGFTPNPLLSNVQVTPNTTVPGVVVLDFTSSTEFSSTAGGLLLGTFTASVPSSASYGAKHVLDITNLVVFDNDPGIPQERVALDDDAVHVSAYLGDASGNRQIQSNDATLLARVNALLDSGFAAYQMADPTIIADISGNNQLQSNDATLLSRFNALLSTPQMPAIPAAPVPLPGLAIDPVLKIGSASSVAGTTVTVPLTLTVPAHEAAVPGVTSLVLLLGIDNTQLAFDTARGFSVAGTAAANFAVTANKVTQGSTDILVFNVGGGGADVSVAIAPGETITLGYLSFDISSSATGKASLNLLGSFLGRTTAVFDSRFESLLLLDEQGLPAPTNGFDPSNDGVITIRHPASESVRNGAMTSNARAFNVLEPPDLRRSRIHAGPVGPHVLEVREMVVRPATQAMVGPIPFKPKDPAAADEELDAIIDLLVLGDRSRPRHKLR